MVKDPEGNLLHEPAVFDPSECIYTDGSCFRGSDPHYATAGAAAIQIHPCGKLAKCVYMSLPRWLPQTASAGEHVACYLGVNHTDPTIPIRPWILSDCASVVRSAADKTFALHSSRPFAGILG